LSDAKPDFSIRRIHFPAGGRKAFVIRMACATVMPAIAAAARHKELQTMNLEKVFFAFFIVLALTLNFGFFLGEIDNPDHHNVYELFAAVVVSLIATILKFGDRAHIGAVLLATSLVADLQLIAAVLLWAVSVNALDTDMTPSIMASIVSLSGGALLANITSVIILVTETVMFRR
jgi:hypothetical protein